MKQKRLLTNNGGFTKTLPLTSLKRFRYKDHIGQEQKRILSERIKTLTGKLYPTSNIRTLKYSQFLWAMRKIGEEHSIPVARWCCHRWDQ